MAYARQKREDSDKVALLARSQRLCPVHKPCAIQLDFYEPNRRRDIDGALCGTVKPVLDGLVQARVLQDDSQKYVTALISRFHVDVDNPRVVVTVIEESDE